MRPNPANGHTRIGVAGECLTDRRNRLRGCGFVENQCQITTLGADLNPEAFALQQATRLRFSGGLPGHSAGGQNEKAKEQQQPPNFPEDLRSSVARPAVHRTPAFFDQNAATETRSRH
jgi:hypothetical protein